MTYTTSSENRLFALLEATTKKLEENTRLGKLLAELRSEIEELDPESARSAEELEEISDKIATAMEILDDAFIDTQKGG